MALVTWSGNPAFADCFAAGDLNALASLGQKTSTLAAPFVDNSVDLALFAQFEASLAALSPAAGAHLIVVLAPLLNDGAAYATSGDGTTAANQIPYVNYPHAMIALRTTATAAQAQQSSPIPLPPGKFQPLLINRAGVALAASGNMVRVRKFSEAVA